MQNTEQLIKIYVHFDDSAHEACHIQTALCTRFVSADNVNERQQNVNGSHLHS